MMASPPPDDGVYLSWQFLEWSFGGAATALTTAFAMIWRIGRRVGGFEKAYAMLESTVENNRLEAAERSDKIDDRLNSVDESNRKIENAVYGLPSSIEDIKRSLAQITSRIDGMFGGGRPHDR